MPLLDDFLACSDLCEEKRFLREAKMLRAMAGDGSKVYIVAVRDAEKIGRIHRPCDDERDQPFSLFFEKAEADEDALALEGANLRKLALLSYGATVDDYTSLAEVELNRRVGAILDIDFDLLSCGELERPFPPSATDGQMAEVAALFDKLRFFHVIEAEFGG